MRLVFVHEENEALFFIVYHLLPEIITFLVTLSRNWVVDSDCVVSLVNLETKNHQKCVRREGFKEHLLVVNLDLTCYLSQKAVLVFLVDLINDALVLLFVEPLAVERCFLLDI